MQPILYKISKWRVWKTLSQTSNLIVYCSFLITAAFMFKYGDALAAIMIMLSMGVYMCFVKIENLERRLRGLE